MSFYITKVDKFTSEVNWGRVVLTIIALVVVCILISWFVYPNVRVYKQNLEGQANLRQQEWEKQIAIEEARALKESATLKAEAEIERAKGVREANQIIAEGLGGPEGYLRYLYINTLNDLDTQLIYVPTEAGLPILEASRK